MLFHCLNCSYFNTSKAEQFFICLLSLGFFLDNCLFTSYVHISVEIFMLFLLFKGAIYYLETSLFFRYVVNIFPRLVFSFQFYTWSFFFRNFWLFIVFFFRHWLCKDEKNLSFFNIVSFSENLNRPVTSTETEAVIKNSPQRTFKTRGLHRWFLPNSQRRCNT